MERVGDQAAQAPAVARLHEPVRADESQHAVPRENRQRALEERNVYVATFGERAVPHPVGGLPAGIDVVKADVRRVPDHDVEAFRERMQEEVLAEEPAPRQPVGDVLRAAGALKPVAHLGLHVRNAFSRYVKRRQEPVERRIVPVGRFRQQRIDDGQHERAVSAAGFKHAQGAPSLETTGALRLAHHVGDDFRAREHGARHLASGSWTRRTHDRATRWAYREEKKRIARTDAPPSRTEAVAPSDTISAAAE